MAHTEEIILELNELIFILQNIWKVAVIQYCYTQAFMSNKIFQNDFHIFIRYLLGFPHQFGFVSCTFQEVSLTTFPNYFLDPFICTIISSILSSFSSLYDSLCRILYWWYRSSIFSSPNVSHFDESLFCYTCR